MILMTSSVVLLVVLQVLWLRSSYEKAYFDLRWKLEGQFRNALFMVRDSTFLRNVEKVSDTDSGASGKKNLFFSRRLDSIPADKIKSVNIDRKSSQIQIFISADGQPDSVKAMLQPIASRFGEESIRRGDHFLYKASLDSLNMDSITFQLKRNLKQANLELPFQIKKTKMGPMFQMPGPPVTTDKPVISDNNRRDERSQGSDDHHFNVFSNKIQSQWVRVPPFNRYAVELSNVRLVIIREIAPQIFFSGILTALIIVAFVFMYRSIQSQQRLMQLKNDFISNVTHELKTPIATVSVALEALKSFKGIDNPRLTEEYLDIAQQELKRLTVLTDKVLTTSLFDEHGIIVEFEKVDLDNTLDQALRSLKLVFEKRGASVDVNKTGDDFILEGSQIHLTNVIHNLIDNALKYSPSQPDINLHLQDLGDLVSLIIADKGIGIPEEYHRKIFEKFFRMPTGDIHNVKGYGLGLSYVDSVIQSHYGKITVSSKPGEGSTFRIILPKKRS